MKTRKILFIVTCIYLMTGLFRQRRMIEMNFTKPFTLQWLQYLVQGNVKLSIWQFPKPISEIKTYIFKVSLLLVVDILSFIINGVLLWHYCKINLLETLKKLQQISNTKINNSLNCILFFFMGRNSNTLVKEAKYNVQKAQGLFAVHTLFIKVNCKLCMNNTCPKKDITFALHLWKLW